MRKFTAVCAVLASMFLATSPAFTKSLVVFPGARAHAMGSAFTAIADDGTAIYYNPAGLAQQKDTGAFLSLIYSAGNVTSNTSLRNSGFGAVNVANGDFPLPRIYASEPGTFTSTEFKTSALIPFVAGYTRYQDVTIAAGFYAAGGGGGTWDDRTASPSRPADIVASSVDGTQVFLIYNVSAAKALTPQVSVGLGIDLVQLNNTEKISKRYIPGAGSPFMAYDANVDMSDTGNAFQVNGGVLYKPADNLRFGAAFRSGTKIKLSGNISMRQTGLTGTLALLGQGPSFDTNYDQYYAYPMSCDVGVAYDPIRKLTIAAGIAQNMFSTLRKDITYTTPSTLLELKNTNTSMNWKDTTNLRFGAEYRYSEKWSFLGGVQTDPTPVPRTTALTLLDTNQCDHTYIDLGAQYSFAPMTITFAITDIISDKPSLGGREFEYSFLSYRLDANYRF